MVSATAPLIGFNGEIIWPMGQILLPVKIGDAKHFTSIWMNFVVIRSPSPYNRIIRRPRVREIQEVPSTAHRLLKFPVSGGILTLRSSRIILLECTMVFKQEAQPSDVIQTAEERIKVAIHPEYPEQTIGIGSTLTSWLSNPVMVKKHDDSWRMCMDFKDLNKACPKDDYLLPEIEWKVEFLC
ncbi:hypothetical protein Tco_0077023 [Tanacetum coccineum]